MLKELLPSDLNDGTNQQVHRLFEQLNATISQRKASQIANTDNTIFMTYWDDSQIVAIALMATYEVISGHKGMIEDVVVNQNYRGQGIGKKLIMALLEKGKRLQLDEILLFSGHHRKPAIHLYTSLGFKLKDSGLYRLPLS